MVKTRTGGDRGIGLSLVGRHSDARSPRRAILLDYRGRRIPVVVGLVFIAAQVASSGVALRSGMPSDDRALAASASLINWRLYWSSTAATFSLSTRAASRVSCTPYR